jgi:very-short-patch-repair endonuclease
MGDAATKLARTQDDVITLQQALSCGLTRSAVRHRLYSGTWLRLFRGVFAVLPVRDEDRARARAACLMTDPDAIVSHVTAARLHKLDGLGPRRDNAVHITRHGRTGHQRQGIVQHWADVPPESRSDIDGIPGTTVSLTVADIGRNGDRLTTICLMESAMRRGVAVRDVLDATAGRPGSAKLPSWLAQADPRSANRLETKVRLDLTDAGIPPDELQYEVHIGRLVLYLDMAYLKRKVAVETDGRDAHTRRAQFVWDRRKWTLLREDGWTLVHLTWDDARSRPYVVQTVNRALATPDSQLWLPTEIV